MFSAVGIADPDLRMLPFSKREKGNIRRSGWTHENHAIELFSNAFMQQKVEYIHNNPVRGGIVDSPEEYKYSSAGVYADKEGFLEIIPVVLEWKTVK